MTALVGAIFAPVLRIAPETAQRAISWLASRGARSSQNYREHRERVVQVLRDVGLHSPELVTALADLPAAAFAEQRLIRHGTVGHLRSIQGDPSGIGLLPLQNALRQGRGLILGCTHIGLFHHALIQSRRLGTETEILVISGNRRQSPLMVQRLAELSGQQMRIVSANTASALAVARHLRRGGIVATMLDLYVDSTLAFDVPFFGRPAAAPAGIFQLAVATGAPIAPICVTTDRAGRKSVEIDSVLQPAASALDLAAETCARIERMVRRHVATWSAWPSLTYRWRLAEARAVPMLSQPQSFPIAIGSTPTTNSPAGT